MRVTDKILQNNFLANLSFSTERLYESQTRVLTNKRVNKPSDDPVGVLNSLAIRTRIKYIEQYQRNISRTKALMQNTESVVNQLSEIFQHVTSLAVQGASDSYGSQDKYSISYEVNQLLEQVYNASNTRSESMYIFAGTRNDAAPYTATRNAQGEITEVKTNGSSGDIMRVIGDNIYMKANVNGEELFEAGQNIFDVLINLRDHLRENDSDKVSKDIDVLNEAAEKINNIQSVIGSRVNRIESADSRAENDLINFNEFLSNTEDIDASEAIMDYQMELLTLQSSLQAGSRLLLPKLGDFLR
ncbi:MAG TPA: flagellar hook-associated protein FlgL [Anaerolineae bacterium]|nr:flagellar hook-associated protein FlgL [Anaerolineae bacterium]